MPSMSNRLSMLDYGSGNFDLPEELDPYFYGYGHDNGRSGLEEPSGLKALPLDAPSPLDKRLKYRQQIEDLLNNQPKMPEGTWSKGLLSGLIGGMAGYLNASPSRRFNLDVTPTIERIRMGDYPQKLSEWQQRLRGLTSLDELQSRDTEEQRKALESQALVNQRNASANYYETGRKELETMKEEGRNTRAQGRTETQRLNSTIPITEARREYIDEMLADERITPEQASDPGFRISKSGYDTWIRANTAEDQIALRKSLAEAKGLNDKEIATLRTDATRYRTDKQFEASMARVEEMRKRTAILEQKATTTGSKTDDEAVKEYRSNNEKAEESYLRNLNSLNRRFRIGGGTGASPGVDSPEKLPPDQRKQYFGERLAIEQRLVNSKKSAERLFSFKTKKEPEFGEIEAPHLENLAKFAEEAQREDKGTPTATPPKSATPTVAPTKPTAKRGTIKESAIAAKFGQAQLAKRIAEAESMGYKVIRGQ